MRAQTRKSPVMSALVTDNKLFEELFTETEVASGTSTIDLQFDKDGGEQIVLKFEDYYPPATATYKGLTLLGLVSIPAGASQVKLGGGLVGSSVGIMVESTYGLTVGNALGMRFAMRYTGRTGAKNSEDIPFEGPASWLEGVFVLAVTL